MAGRCSAATGGVTKRTRPRIAPRSLERDAAPIATSAAPRTSSRNASTSEPVDHLARRKAVIANAAAVAPVLLPADAQVHGSQHPHSDGGFDATYGRIPRSRCRRVSRRGAKRESVVTARKTPPWRDAIAAFDEGRPRVEPQIDG